MKLRHVSGMVCSVVATCLLLAGCDGSQQAPLSPELTTVKVGELPELDDPIGPLDQQRIDVAPPKGWYVPSRSSRWIIRFAASEQARYPSIIVRAEDYPGILDVTKENVGAFAEEVAAAFEKDDSAAKQSMTIAPIEIGRFVGVTYRRRGRAPYGVKEIIVDRLLLETVVAGRKYTLELQTRDGDLERYRGYLFAVAAGIKFLKGEPGGTPPPPATDPKSPLEGKDQV
jgi:hypothetical protein